VNTSYERHLFITDSKGAKLVSTLPQQCSECVLKQPSVETTNNCGLPGRRRRGSVFSKAGSVFFCSNDPNLIESSKLFKKELDFYLQSLQWFEIYKIEIQKAEAHKTRRLFHNLISLNAHALQELYSVISQEWLSSIAGFKSQKNAISQYLKNKPDLSAELFLKSLKNAAAIKSELAVFQKLYDPSPLLKFSRHEIHRVILNVANYFFQDFSDKQLKLIIQSSDVKILLDYESMQVAFYHILDNSAKYALQASEIRISFFGVEDFAICFEMTSLHLSENERDSIFQDGFSGAQAKLISKSGQGLGVGLIVDLLKLNGATIEMYWGEPITNEVEDLGDVSLFSKNRFVIRFLKDSIFRNR
jgi:hypothetical protein